MKETILWVSPDERFRLLQRSEEGDMLLSFRAARRRLLGEIRFLATDLFYFQCHGWLAGWYDIGITNSIDRDWLVHVIDDFIPKKDKSSKSSLEMFSTMQLMQAHEQMAKQQRAMDDKAKKNSR